jgi:hypothetical protein
MPVLAMMVIISAVGITVTTTLASDKRRSAHAE